MHRTSLPGLSPELHLTTAECINPSMSCQHPYLAQHAPNSVLLALQCVYLLYSVCLSVILGRTMSVHIPCSKPFLY